MYASKHPSSNIEHNAISTSSPSPRALKLIGREHISYLCNLNESNFKLLLNSQVWLVQQTRQRMRFAKGNH